MYIIYLVTNLKNNKKYVGITKRTLEKRFVNHFSSAFNSNAKGYNTPFKAALRKYGKNGFKIEVIEKVETIEQANEKEIFYIEKYDTYCYKSPSNGYNATLGGDGVKTIKRKIAQISKNDGSIIKIFNSIADIEQSLNIGHISECLNGNMVSSGGYCWDYYDTYSQKTEEEKFNYICIRTKKIVQLTKENKVVKIWDTASEAAEFLKINNGRIVSACKGRSNTCAGYVWREYVDYINNKKPVYKKEKIYKKDINNNIIEVFNTVKEAAEELPVTPQTLGRHINKDKEYLGFIWTRE